MKYHINIRSKFIWLTQLISVYKWVRLVSLCRRLNFQTDGLFNIGYSRIIRTVAASTKNTNTLLWSDGIAYLPARTHDIDYSHNLAGRPRTDPQKSFSSLIEYESTEKDRITNFDFYRESLLASDQVAKLTCSSTLHRDIYRQLCIPFFITDISAWVTYGQTDDLGANAMLWHIDYDRILEVKAFIFLNDVSDFDGFQYVERSHCSKLLINDSGEQSLDAYRSYPGLRVRTCYGQAGTTLLSLNWGVHRDMPPKSHGRAKVVLQLQLGIEPFGIRHTSEKTNIIRICKSYSSLQRYALAAKVSPFIFQLFRFD